MERTLVLPDEIWQAIDRLCSYVCDTEDEDSPILELAQEVQEWMEKNK